MIDGRRLDEGVGESRSAVIRQGVHHLAESVRRGECGGTIAEVVPHASPDCRR